MIGVYISQRHSPLETGWYSVTILQQPEPSSLATAIEQGRTPGACLPRVYRAYIIHES